MPSKLAEQIKKKVDGLISAEEGDALMDYAARCPSSGVIVEIGAFKGLSTVYIATANPDAFVFSIDLWDTTNSKDVRIRKKKSRQDFDDPEVLQYYRHVTRDLKNVTPVKGDSREVGKVWSTPIDMLFLDGAHDYESVKTDVELWVHHIVPGGFLAFHDAVKTKGKVSDVIDEYIRIHPDEWLDEQLYDRLAVFQRAV